LQQNCESACSNLKGMAASTTWDSTYSSVWFALTTKTTEATNNFCIKQQYEGGPTAGVNCDDINVNCYVTFANGIQKKVECST